MTGGCTLALPSSFITQLAATDLQLVCPSTCRDGALSRHQSADVSIARDISLRSVGRSDRTGEQPPNRSFGNATAEVQANGRKFDYAARRVRCFLTETLDPPVVSKRARPVLSARRGDLKAPIFAPVPTSTLLFLALGMHASSHELADATSPAVSAPESPAPATNGSLAPALTVPTLSAPGNDDASDAPKVTSPDALDAEFVAPFAVESLELSAVLKSAMQDNQNLQARLVDVGISEAQALGALGAYDLMVTSQIRASKDKTTPRGSAFFFSTGSTTQGANVGVSQKFLTGATLGLTLDFNRQISKQPINFANPGGGSTDLARYNVSPQLNFTHPLLRGLGVRVNKVPLHRAEVGKSTAQAAQQQLAQELVRDLMIGYWDLLFAKKDLQNKRYSLELAGQQLELTQAQVRAGKLSPVDAKVIEQSLAARESELIAAEQLLLDRSVDLRLKMGQQLTNRPVLGVLPATDPVLADSGALDVTDEIARVVANNPQIRQLELALATRRLDELEAANARLPQLDLTLNFNPRGVSIDTAPQQNQGTPAVRGSWANAFRNFVTDDVREKGLLADYSISGNLQLTWDVQNRGAKARHEQVLLEMRKAEINLELQRQTLASSVIRFHSTMRAAEKRVQVAQLAVGLAEQNLAAEQARFRVGRKTNYDVLFRIDELAKARAQALSAQIEVLKAKINLQSLTGEILSGYGLALSSSSAADR